MRKTLILAPRRVGKTTLLLNELIKHQDSHMLHYYKNDLREYQYLLRYTKHQMQDLSKRLIFFSSRLDVNKFRALRINNLIIDDYFHFNDDMLLELQKIIIHCEVKAVLASSLSGYRNISSKHDIFSRGNVNVLEYNKLKKKGLLI